MIIRRFYCILNFTIATLVCFGHSQQLGCQHPSNYSDFSLVLINQTLIVTGANMEQLEVWTQDISNGFSTANDCWINHASNTTLDYSPYKNGIAFQYSNTSIAVQAGDNGTPLMSTMAIFDVTTNTWSDPVASIKGTQPVTKARMSVSLNTTTNAAWFYGGRAESSATPNYYNTFYNFDINTNTWNWPTTFYSGGYRPARYGHTSSLISDRLFILGGKTAVHSEDNSWVGASFGDFQNVLVFDTVSHQAITMATIGDIPPARYSFTAVDAPDATSIVLFGGQNVSAETSFDATNDVYVLDTCTLNWTKPEISGIPPIARAGHEAIVYLGRYMVVTMGIQNFDPTTGPVYVNDSAILDMRSWTWINSIPIGPTKNKSVKSSCRFIFPVVVPDDDGGNNMTDTFNPSVVKYTNDDSRTKKLALGLTFGCLGLLVLVTALVIFILRIRRDVDAKQNPRWIPSVLRKKKPITESTTI
ncbi:hypothetical protein INT47_010708 [Mucor saturninus]|uniref:Galactose oxidase n=1 Tax=Mucor saturninus TaxID=64648 RepID=A0A8H7QIQ4_9FUNG|nr:hypothetical protein INT47_010708 [Mucor saturninus]